MRSLLAAILVLFSTAAIAETPPTATDVIGALYALSRFQQGLLETADLKGSQEVKTLASLRAEEAAVRDRKLQQIQAAAGIEPRIDRTNPAVALMTGPADADGPSYVRQFYATQVSQYEEVIGLLERYLQAPDDGALGAFVLAELPALRARLSDDTRTLADR